MFRTSNHARHPVLSSFAGKGECVWTYVNLTQETVWFCATYENRASADCSWPETILLSTIEQVVELCHDFSERVEVTQLMLVSPGQLNKSEKWIMEPLREIWRGQDPHHGDTVHVFALQDGRHYVDAIHAVERDKLQGLKCVVCLPDRGSQTIADIGQHSPPLHAN